MDKLGRQIKMYDRFLRVKKMLDGTVKVYRQSPFSRRQYDVLIIQNQFIGSGKWVLIKISLKDSQRHNIYGDVLKTNRRITEEKNDNRMHEEVAEFMLKESIV